jgi:hypothetical protein
VELLVLALLLLLLLLLTAQMMCNYEGHADEWVELALLFVHSGSYLKAAPAVMLLSAPFC